MASELSTIEEQGQHCDVLVDGHQQNEENNLASASSPHQDAPEPDEAYREPKSSSKNPSSTENRLRPVADVINRIIWDPRFDSEDYTIVYEDRFEGRLEAGLGSWRKDLTDEEFIPQHRIIYIKRKSDGGVVWDKRRRTDKIFLSGNSAFSWLAFLE